MEKNEFKCTRCGGVFEKGWSDAEAAEEMHRELGGAPRGDARMGVLCDECYREFMKWWKAEGERKYRRR
jgi:hypothetical protein